MTSGQQHRLLELSIGLFGALDAADTLSTDRDAADKLYCAALILSRQLKQLVDEIDTNGAKQ
jgi:hypothetical protein